MRRPRRPPTSCTACQRFDVVTGAQVKTKADAPTYTRVFGEA